MLVVGLRHLSLVAVAQAREPGRDAQELDPVVDQILIEAVDQRVAQLSQRLRELATLRLEASGVVDDGGLAGVDLERAQLEVADLAAGRQPPAEGPLPALERGVLASPAPPPSGSSSASTSVSVSAAPSEPAAWASGCARRARRAVAA
ncbi:MAG: hypothetical protein HS111_08885 [Kofleriaceae bacterium]|nr:hypothetical protein [Kofleriaceae bacterium]